MPLPKDKMVSVNNLFQHYDKSKQTPATNTLKETGFILATLPEGSSTLAVRDCGRGCVL